MRTTSSLAFALLLAACGGGGLKTTTGTDGGTQDLAASTGGNDLATTQHDLSTGPIGGTDGGSSGNDDAGTPGDVACGTMTCTTGMACCVTASSTPTYACMTTCGSGTISASCDGPEDCSGNACCANIAVGSGTPSGAAACQSSTNNCSTGAINLSSESIETRLCHSAADCAGYMGTDISGATTSYGNCCSDSSVAYKFCGPSSINGVFGISCQ